MSAGLTDDNIVEQDHRAIKYIVRPILGFKSMRCAQSLLAGIETLHMIRKGQWTAPKGPYRDRIAFNVGSPPH